MIWSEKQELIDWTMPARLSEYEINQHIGEMQKLGTLVNIWIDGLRDRKIALKKQAIGE